LTCSIRLKNSTRTFSLGQQSSTWNKLKNNELGGKSKTCHSKCKRSQEEEEQNFNQDILDQIKQYLVENLTDEEIHTDIDLLRKIFSDEQNIYATFDLDEEDTGIKDRYYKKINTLKQEEIKKKKKQVKNKFKHLKVDNSRRLYDKVPRRNIPNTQSYIQLVSARNQLTSLKSADYKWGEENIREDLRDIQLEKLNLKQK